MMNHKVNKIRTTNGEEVSLLGSYLAWRDNPSKKLPIVPKLSDGSCQICDNAMRILRDKKYGDVRCLCLVEEEEKHFSIRMEPFRTPIPIKTIQEMIPHGTPQFSRLIESAKDMILEWMEWPTEWLTIAGSVGTGKTHMLLSIANYFGPWALYITSGMLESLSYKYLNRNEDITLQEMVDDLSHVPILIVDDIGSDYGSNFAMSTFRKIVDFRYINYAEFPTVIGTNLMPDALRLYDQRLADRFLDKNIANYIELVGESYRRTDHGNSK